MESNRNAYIVGGVFLAIVLALVVRRILPPGGNVDSSAYVLPAATTPTEALVGVLDIQLASRGVGARGATGVIVNYKTATLLLTAQHLFGPAGGMPELDDRDMPGEVSKIVLTPPAGTPTYTSTRALYLPGAAAVDSDPFSTRHDVAAFLLTTPVRALSLATSLPAIGTPVRIRVADGNEVDATITDATEDRLVYRWKDQAAGRGSSGAPVLSPNDEVLGLHLTFNGTEGHGNPSISILKLLAKRIR